jgi:hypothetical protein
MPPPPVPNKFSSSDVPAHGSRHRSRISVSRPPNDAQRGRDCNIKGSIPTASSNGFQQATAPSAQNSTLNPQAEEFVSPTKSTLIAGNKRQQHRQRPSKVFTPSTSPSSTCTLDGKASSRTTPRVGGKVKN